MFNSSSGSWLGVGSDGGITNGAGNEWKGRRGRKGEKNLTLFLFCFVFLNYLIVLAVVQWGDVIFAGGVFDQNGTRNLVKIQNCSTMNCGKSDWEPGLMIFFHYCFILEFLADFFSYAVNKDWTFSENSTIFKLAIYENILIFGGDFILQTGQGALGQKVFYNLVFYDLVREKGNYFKKPFLFIFTLSPFSFSPISKWF